MQKGHAYRAVGREGGRKKGEGDRNRQVELFYRYLPYEPGQNRGTVTSRIIETHGQWASDSQSAKVKPLQTCQLFELTCQVFAVVHAN